MKSQSFLASILCLTLCVPAFPQDGEGGGKEAWREQARSMVATKFGIVATSQTLASAAGAKVLEMGGSAVDAAIAANATLGLVEPTANGMGGDLFAIVYEAKTGKVYGLNSSGWAPSGLTVDLLQSKGLKRMPMSGIYSVTVPGAVAGWAKLHGKFGKLPWKQLFQPSIYYAENGFPITELISNRWHVELSRLKHPRAQALWLPDGKPPVPGQWFRNPTLAKSLKMVADKGRDGFYKGSIAESILAVSKEEGGTFTAADLADFDSEWVEPISTSYRGWTVTELPPNGHGIAVLGMMNMLEKFPIGEWGHNSTKSLHALIEAKKLAYADMLKYTGDPRFSQAPVKEMISKELGARHAAEIDMSKAACHVTPALLSSLSKMPGADTIYMTAVDREGNIVSLIQSNFAGFGSGVVPPDAGFMLQNRGGLFTLEKDQPNTLKPRKRPLHTIIPGFLSNASTGTHIGFGIMGGWNQAQAHAQFVSNIVDHKMNIQAAMEAARFTKSGFDGCEVTIESRVSPKVIEELKSMGHVVTMLVPYSQAVGGGQAVMVNGSGIKFGASDARKDGAAVPESPGFWAAAPKN